MAMSLSDARSEAARLAPLYPVTVKFERGAYWGIPDDFNDEKCSRKHRGYSEEDARGGAFHLIMQALICRLRYGREIPPVTTV